MKALALLAALGVGLIVIAMLVGGKSAMTGGTVALIAQIWAVTLLRPKMRAPNPEFMARWLGGMAIRFLALAVLIMVVVTHRVPLALVPAVFGFLGVLLPLLFLETRFLR